ncbi:hypothetical protein, partial [Acinetobacter baumannii]|uniref:hypothetical protein n=1 Tax=Acinetobacter baumannii TaxID=470 RepID=UPI003891598F
RLNKTVEHCSINKRGTLKIIKKPTLGKMGYKLETTALISKENYKTFRIRCIMLILGNLKL